MTIHTIEQGGVDGLLLFSPGFQSKTPILERFASLAAVFTDGYQAEEKNMARYTSAPLNGAIAYTASARKLRSLLDENDVDVPALIAISEADSIVDPVVVKELFLEHFSHASSRMIWYGESGSDQPNITSLSMKLDAHKISTGSHMSPLFTPSNPYYGVNGERRMCANSFDDDATERCEAGEEVWFSAWGYEEDGKIHARLTWNPYYPDLEQDIARMTRSADVN